MSIVVWSTEAADTSAILLAQTMDDVVFTKEAHADPQDDNEETQALREEDAKVVFYGPVHLPAWFVERYDQDRMFNHPDNTARRLLNKARLSRELTAAGLPALQYHRVNEESVYTRVRERIGQRSFDVVVKNGMTVVERVNNAGSFDNAKRNVHYACAHIDPVKKFRVYMGVPTHTDDGLICMSMVEKRALSFFEMLTRNTTTEVRQHIRESFNQGLLTEDMGGGRVAWTEEQIITPNQLEDQQLRDTLVRIGNTMRQEYGLDFWAVDVSVTGDNSVYITNALAAPSLQNDAVLEHVSNYFKALLTYGRQMTADRLAEMVRDLTQEQIQRASELLRQEGLLRTAM